MNDPYAWIDPFVVAEELEAAKRNEPRVRRQGYDEAVREFGASPGAFAQGAVSAMTRLLGQSWGEQEGLRIASAVAEKVSLHVRSRPEDMTVDLCAHYHQPFTYVLRMDPRALMVRS